MTSKPFGRFQGEKGAKKKERIRQEKKQVRRETKEYFEKKKAEEKAKRSGTYPVARESQSEQRSSRAGSHTRPERRTSTSQKQFSGFSGSGATVSGKQTGHFSKTGAASSKSASRGSKAGTAYAKTQSPEKTEKRFKSDTTSSESASRFSKPGKAYPKTQSPEKSEKHSSKADTSGASRSKSKSSSQKTGPSPVFHAKGGGEMPLNKFIAHAGICSRRDAADLVKSGKVTVNGQTILEPGFKVAGSEDIKVAGKKISARKNLVYILLNKPKDYITTMDDPQGRKTVLDIVKSATSERIYPIGRLDRNTTGVLLLTNDGELAQKLSHPSYQVKKIYEVKLDRPLGKKDFDSLANGVTLEDGFIAPDSLAYADAKDKSVIGIEIHSGRNRIVRRIFEHLGYDVRNLDRVLYANLTKKNVERGKWRFLTEKEVRLLKYLNASYTRK